MTTSAWWRLTGIWSTFAEKSEQRFRAAPIELDTSSRRRSTHHHTDLAVPLRLIVNELVTNAMKHFATSSGNGRIQIVHKTAPDSFSITVSDEGDGPQLHADTQTAGIGARMVEGFARKIDGSITKGRNPAGYSVTVTVPLARIWPSIECRLRSIRESDETSLNSLPEAGIVVKGTHEFQQGVVDLKVPVVLDQIQSLRNLFIKKLTRDRSKSTKKRVRNRGPPPRRELQLSGVRLPPSA